jgi:phosphate transport system substrate-binding protein
MRKSLIGVGLLFSTFALSTQAFARDQIRVVGSSTVFPFTTTVAETFGNTTDFKTPIVEATGTGGGFKIFCAGIGTGHPDFNNASRAIKKGEVEMCAKNGISVTELKVGYDGIVFANSRDADQLSITRRELFLALAKQIPDGKGGLIDNPNQKWSDVNPSLPNKKIEVLGPPPTSGTRDAFVELVMESGAKSFPELKALRKKNKNAFKAIAHAMREDGLFIEAGENDNLIIQKLASKPKCIWYFWFQFS